MPPANIVNNPSLDGIDAYSLITSKSAGAPSIIPTVILAFSCSLANSEITLIGSSKSLPNKIAFGPSRKPSKLIPNSSTALLNSVFLYTLTSLSVFLSSFLKSPSSETVKP